MQTTAARLPRLLLGALLTAMALAAPVAACATVYKCVDANQQTTYSSEPCGKHAQEVNAPLSVTPPFVTPEVAVEKKGGVLDKLGLGSTDAVSALLFALIPLSFLAMFLLSRKSQNAK